MKTVQHSDRDTYRVIVVRRDASEVLFVFSESVLSLPRVEVFPQQRIAHQLIAEVSRQWSLQTYCLFVPSIESSEKDAQRENFAVLESIKDSEEPPTGTCWLPRTAFACHRVVSVRHADAISQSLKELDSFIDKAKVAPFGRPGWLRNLFTWSQEQLSPFGLRVNGNFRQYTSSPAFSLIRLGTNGPAVWFKATGEPNLHELSITSCLARLFPGNLPRILAIHPSWNGWLSEEVSGTTLDQCEEISVWERVAETLADLQIASIGKCSVLLDAQIKDLRLPRLIELIPSFVFCMTELMAVQQKQSPPPLRTFELDFLGERLQEALSMLQDLGFPDTLGHCDFNPENILVSPHGCVFVDWAEACVTNPLVTFEYLLEQSRNNIGNDASAPDRITKSYLRYWHSLLSPDDLEQAKAVSPLVALFTYAASGNSWASPEIIRTSALAGCLRGLTRRMHREAMYQCQRRERCPM